MWSLQYCNWGIPWFRKNFQNSRWSSANGPRKELGARDSLQNVKIYFKTGYRNHCEQDGSTYPGYGLKFALSDPNDSDLEEQCAHEHTTSCGECDDITIIIDKSEHVIKSKDTKFYSKEQQEDKLYDFERSRKAITLWKAHIMRTTNQERTKQEILENLDPSSNLVVMDWAMKFVQIRFWRNKAIGMESEAWAGTLLVWRHVMNKRESCRSLYLPIYLTNVRRIGLQ